MLYDFKFRSKTLEYKKSRLVLNLKKKKKKLEEKNATHAKHVHFAYA